MTIRIAINGYGNLGRGVEAAVTAAPDMELVAVFTRRKPDNVTINSDAPVVSVDEMADWADNVDVCILCGGSAQDLEEQGPATAAFFNTVDSFDTHAKIPAYFQVLNQAATEAGHLSLLSTGWDPGLFSLLRVLGESVLPNGQSYTFWGSGISQGHSDAIRRVPGVADGVQYTVPKPETVESVKAGTAGSLSAAEMHTRECFVVLEEGADAAAVAEAITTMPNYFADYETTVTFVDADELARDHQGMPHGGQVIRSGQTAALGGKSGDEPNLHTIGFELALGSNPAFTGSVLTACARAVARQAKQGRTGAITIFDLPIGDLSPKCRASLMAHEL